MPDIIAIRGFESSFGGIPEGHAAFYARDGKIYMTITETIHETDEVELGPKLARKWSQQLLRVAEMAEWQAKRLNEVQSNG